jgi:hypothetical protein
MKLFFASLVFTFSVFAANVSGKWTGTFTDKADTTKHENFIITLTQNGDTLTGTAGSTAEDQGPISNGKVDGNNVTFDIKADEVSIHLTLQLMDNHLKGQIHAEVAGEKHDGTIDLTRSEITSEQKRNNL